MVSVGRTIDTAGNVRPSQLAVGSGMIRLVWKSSPPNGRLLRSGNTSPLVGSRSAGALPALSDQVWKMHRLGGADAEHDAQHLGVLHALGQLRVQAGAALLDRAEVEPGGVGDRLQVLLVLRSALVRGIAGHRPLASAGTACGKLSPRSGFLVRARYRVHQLVSTVSSIRLVIRLSFADPWAVLPGSVRNWSRFTAWAPRDCR